MAPSTTGSSDESAALPDIGGDAPGSVFSDVSLPRRTTTDRFDTETPPPTAVVDACRGGLPEPSHPHRYREWRVEPGDELAVVGVLASAGTSAANAVVANDDDGAFAISANAHWRTVLVHLARTAAYALFAAGALAVAAATLPTAL